MTAKALAMGDEYQCCVCYDVPSLPWQVCSGGGHLLCEPCRNMLPKPRRCPMCRAPVDKLVPLRFMDALVAPLRVPCGNAGCSANAVVITELAAHRAACPHRTAKCALSDEGCNGVVARGAGLVDHYVAHHGPSTSVTADGIEFTLAAYPEGTAPLPPHHYFSRRDALVVSRLYLAHHESLDISSPLVHMLLTSTNMEHKRVRMTITCEARDVHWSYEGPVHPFVVDHTGTWGHGGNPAGMMVCVLATDAPLTVRVDLIPPVAPAPKRRRKN